MSSVGSSTWVQARRRTQRIKYVVLGLVAIPWILLPLWVLVVNSWKSESDATSPSVGLPKHWALLSNLHTVISQGQYFVGLRNSLIVTTTVVLSVILLGSMAAWSFARSRSRSMQSMYYLSALSIILPPAIVPTVYLLNHTHLTGSVVGYILALTGTRVGVVVFLTTGYVRALPIDFEEAAQLDGANRWQVYWHVILPLLRSVLFTAAVMTVINVWNDFLFGLYLLQGAAQQTIPLTLYNVANAGQYGVRWNLVFMHVILASLPLLIAYVVLQRRVMSGLTEGGVTG